MLNDGRSSHKTKIAGKIHVTRMILKKKKKNWVETCVPEERKSSLTFVGREIHWEREFQRLRGEYSSWVVAARTARTSQRVLSTSLPSLAQDTHLLGCWWLGVETQASENKTQGEEWGCVGGDSTRGWRVVQATTRPVHRKDSGSTIEVPLLTRAWREEWGPAIAGLFSVWLKLVQLCLYEF